jgi:hypothetical protein
MFNVQHEGKEGKPSRHPHPSFHCTTIIICNVGGGILHNSIIINFVDLSSAYQAAKTAAQSTINNTEASTLSCTYDGWS